MKNLRGCLTSCLKNVFKKTYITKTLSFLTAGYSAEKCYENARKSTTATKRPKSDRMEVVLDGNYRFFYEDSDFEVEIGPRWPKVAENGPKIFRINFTNLIKNLIFYQKLLLNFVDQPYL